MRAAVAQHRGGRLGDAEAGYRRVLARHPGHPEALHMLGLAAFQQGRAAEAAELVGRAIAGNDRKPAYFNTQGLVLAALGRHEDAIASYGRALALRPDDADALANRGSALRALGRLPEALDSLDRALALRPDVAQAHNNRGLVLADLGQLDAALASQDRALALRPGYPEAQLNRAAVLLRLGRPQDALPAIDAAIGLQPGMPEAHLARAEALRDLGRLDEALASLDRALLLSPDALAAHAGRTGLLTRLERFPEALASAGRMLELLADSPEGLCQRAGILLALQRPAEALADLDRALAIRPDFVEALNDRGNALRDLRRPADALACFDRVLALRPEFAVARCNRGNALCDLGRLDDAAAEFVATIAQDPGMAEAHNNLGTTLTALGRAEAALADYDRAIALKPDYAEARIGRAYNLLLHGRLREGWEQQEWRWRTAKFRPHLRNLPQPRWRGEPLAGRTLLLYAEQGLGDTIQFCRYATLIAERAAGDGGQVVLEVQPPLLPLLRDQLAGVRVVAAGAALPPFDLHCPLLSLPGAFGTELSTIPAPAAYLHAEPARRAHWRERLAAHEAPRVGLAWSGNPLHSRDGSRSMPLARLLPLLDAGASLFALQPEVRPDDRATLAATPAIADLGPALTDLVETAAAIAALDLVIAVDTSVAHLAAALGKPVWLLVAFAPDWRWLREREDSPWYPTMRLFRQPSLGDWDCVIARVRAALAQLGGTAPDDAATHFRRGNELAEQERFAESLACFDRAIALEPGLFEAHCNRGNALRELRRPAEALASYDRALALRPTAADAHSNRGNVLTDLGRPDEAIVEYARAMAERPGLAEPHCNMAYALTALGRPQEALAVYDRAIALKPDYADAHVGRSSNLLLLGRFREGWDEQEWRWRQRRFLAIAQGFAGSRWEGEHLAGRTLLLIAEQGLGDTVQFCRYVPSLAERAAGEGGRVLLEVQAPLLPLLRDQFPGVPVHALGAARPPFDLQCPLLSLPRLFGTELATIPAPRGYLSADPARVARWRDRLQPYATPRVGLAWSGNWRQLEDARRSVPLAKLLPLLGAGGTLFGLQPQVRDADRATLAATPAIVDLGPSFADFAETAAAIAALDLVIAVDTSVAHVAAALGTPTWVLLSFAPDWRWLRGREDFPWYPSVRLFRQPARSDWDRVISRIRAELAGWKP